MQTRAQTLTKVLAKLQAQQERFQTLSASAPTAKQRARFAQLAIRIQERIAVVNQLINGITQ